MQSGRIANCGLVANRLPVAARKQLQKWKFWLTFA